MQFANMGNQPRKGVIRVRKPTTASQGVVNKVLRGVHQSADDTALMSEVPVILSQLSIVQISMEERYLPPSLVRHRISSSWRNRRSVRTERRRSLPQNRYAAVPFRTFKMKTTRRHCPHCPEKGQEENLAKRLSAKSKTRKEKYFAMMIHNSVLPYGFFFAIR